MAKKKIVFIEETPKEDIPNKIELCKVLYIKEKIFAVDFKGYGLSFSTEDNFLDTDLIPTDYIEISYTGEIGSPDFKYIPIYTNSIEN